MKKFSLLTLSVLLASCGGGGGGSEYNPSPQPPSPTTYSINGQVYGSNLSTLTAYSDSNFSGALDNGELSVSVGSDGAFSLSTTNQSLYNCLRDMPLAAESSSNYFFSYNPDGSSGTVILNPFVSVFSDFIYPDMYWDNPSIDGENCSTFNNIRAGILKRNTDNVLKRIEKYEQLTYNDLLIDPSNPVMGNPIDNTRTADFQKFWQSIKTIEETIANEFETAVAAAGFTVALSTRAELDTSNLRIFLNNTSYPNPSTDTTPVANSIDAVAGNAGMDLIASLDNAVGTWREVLKVSVWDMNISNNGDMLIDRSNCWINFSNLCKLEPTIQNVFQYDGTSIIDTYTKETSRGTEYVSQAEDIFGGESNYCDILNSVGVAETLSTSVRQIEYVKIIGDGYYDTSDLSCYAYTQYYDFLTILEKNTNGETMFFEIFQDGGTSWDSPDIFRSIQDTYFDYDTLDDGENIEQIPSEFIDAFLDMSLSWAEMKTVVDANYNNSDIYVYFGYMDRNFNRVLLTYRPYWGDANCQIYNFYLASDVYITRTSDDGVYTFDEVVNWCIERIEFGTTITDLSGGEIKNRSPYRGLIDD